MTKPHIQIKAGESLQEAVQRIHKEQGARERACIPIFCTLTAKGREKIKATCGNTRKFLLAVELIQQTTGKAAEYLEIAKAMQCTRPEVIPIAARANAQGWIVKKRY